eukprot:2492534-Rhodomonas_salina.1
MVLPNLNCCARLPVNSGTAFEWWYKRDSELLTREYTRREVGEGFHRRESVGHPTYSSNFSSKLSPRWAPNGFGLWTPS